MRRRTATLLNYLIAILDHRIARWSPVAQTDRKNEKGREREREMVGMAPTSCFIFIERWGSLFEIQQKETNIPLL